MRRETILLIAMLLVCPGTGLTQPSQSTTGSAVYDDIRDIIEKQFEESVKEYHKVKNPANTPADDEIVIRGEKLLFYNKAYIVTQCMVRSGKTTNNQNSYLQFVKSVDACAGQLFTMLEQFVDEIEKWTADPRGISCFQMARLKEMESEYPPYGFLAESSSTLVDVKQLWDCLERIQDNTT
jgi:hypothetical protein